MASTPFISHSINGYSRYEIPENVAFSASAGILYPARVSFMNARDVQYVQVGAIIRTNPALLPTFTPFRVSLHRFFCPMQLYHPEMRVNASKFDFQTLSTNCQVASLFRHDTNQTPAAEISNESKYLFGRSLLSFLGLWSGERLTPVGNDALATLNPVSSLGSRPLGMDYVNADPILAYYDIVRSYYSFSQLGTFSLAFPCPATSVGGPFELHTPDPAGNPTSMTVVLGGIIVGKPGSYWRQAICKLDPMDELYESGFYPKRGEVRGLYYDRSVDICEAIYQALGGRSSGEPTEAQVRNSWNFYGYRYGGFGVTEETSSVVPLKCVWASFLPYGVAPAVADRFSRLLPSSSVDDVSLTSINTVRGLAFAAKLQAYKDLLSSGGNRFTDWLMTFFAAKVAHVDRPVLVYSSSFYMNSSPVFSQQGGDSLGSYAGVVQGDSSFGKKAQRYCFDEPGYLVDIFCIRPLYYWAGVQKDYARYDKMDYFNPIFNEVGYETLPFTVFGGNSQQYQVNAIAKQPCYNEFRSSFDRVLGDMALVPGYDYGENVPVLASWVQQRSNLRGDVQLSTYLQSVYFTDIDQSNSVFASRAEDNFFVNLYYNVSCKSLVSKNFATNLAIR